MHKLKAHNLGRLAAPICRGQMAVQPPVAPISSKCRHVANVAVAMHRTTDQAVVRSLMSAILTKCTIHWPSIVHASSNLLHKIVDLQSPCDDLEQPRVIPISRSNPREYAKIHRFSHLL